MKRTSLIKQSAIIFVVLMGFSFTANAEVTATHRLVSITPINEMGSEAAYEIYVVNDGAETLTNMRLVYQGATRHDQQALPILVIESLAAGEQAVMLWISRDESTQAVAVFPESTLIFTGNTDLSTGEKVSTQLVSQEIPGGHVLYDTATTGQ